MKVRKDSPFAPLTDEEQMIILEASESCTLENLVKQVEMLRPGLGFSTPALRRFVQRLKEEGLREDVEDSEESMEQLANAGRSGRARDGVVEAMRRKLFAAAVEAKDTAKAMEVFKLMKQEQKEDRAMALEERRMLLEEENAKQEWKREELRMRGRRCDFCRWLLRSLWKGRGALRKGWRGRGMFCPREGRNF
jgi:hypothetical protein